MIRSETSADILAAIITCLGQSCSYQVIQSRGIFPAECDSIVAVWGDSSNLIPDDCGSGPCETFRSHKLMLVLTKCCSGIDAQINLDSTQESDESICFYRDVEIIEKCIICTDFSQLLFDNGLSNLYLSGTRFDPTVHGGCMTAYIDIVINETFCCE